MEFGILRKGTMNGSQKFEDALILKEEIEWKERKKGDVVGSSS
jgi:hypothetical protein